MEPLSAFLLIGLGAWVAVDSTALGQFMVSRPLVSATIAGAILGDPMIGAVIGGMLELLFLGHFPVGGAQLPEPGPAAIPAVVLGVAWAGPSIQTSGGALAGGIALGLILSWVGGRSVGLQRSVNGRMSAGAWRRGGGPDELRGVQLSALALDATRGAVLTGMGLLVVWVVVWAGGRLPVADWPLTGAETLALAGIAGALGLGRLAQGAAGGSGRVVQRPLLLLVVGVGCGVALAVTIGGLAGLGSGSEVGIR